MRAVLHLAAVLAYHVLYDSPGDFDDVWPFAPATLVPDVDVTEDAILEIDIRRTRVALELTMGGARIEWPADPPWAFSFAPRLRIGPVGPSFWTNDLVIWDYDTEPRAPSTRFIGYLVPGTYGLYYGVTYGFPSDAESTVVTTSEAAMGCWTVPETTAP